MIDIKFLKFRSYSYLVCFTHAGVLEEPDLSRLMLIGTNHISNPSSFFRSTSSIQMTEVFEYAKGLNGTGLGFLPYFQLYKFMHALELADLGMTSRAARYYDAVEGAVKDAFSSGNVFASPLLLEMVQEFSDRISPQVKVSGKAESAGGWLSKLGNSLSGAAIGKGLDNFMAAAVGETITSPLVAESTEKRQKYDAPLVDIPSLPEAGLGLHDNICHSTADSVSYSEQSYGFQNTSLFATDGMSSQARYSQADSNFSYPSQVHPSFTEDTPQQNQSQGFYEDYNAGYAIDAFHQQYVNDSAHQQYPQYEDQQDYYQGYNQNGQDSQYGHPLNYGETQGPVSEQQGNGYLESNADQMQESNINYEQDYDQGGFTSGGANKANQSGAYQSFSPQLKSQYADPQNYYQQGNAQYGEQVDQGGLTYFDEIPPEEVEDLQKPPPSAASGGNYASYADIKPIPLPVPTPVVARQSPSVPPPMNAQDSHVPAPGDNESSDPLGLGNSISNKSRLSSKSGAESDAANVDVKKSQQDGKKYLFLYL